MHLVFCYIISKSKCKFPISFNLSTTFFFTERSWLIRQTRAKRATGVKMENFRFAFNFLELPKLLMIVKWNKRKIIPHMEHVRLYIVQARNHLVISSLLAIHWSGNGSKVILYGFITQNCYLCLESVRIGNWIADDFKWRFSNRFPLQYDWLNKHWT